MPLLGASKWRARAGRTCFALAAVIAAAQATRMVGVPWAMLWEYGTSMPTGVYALDGRYRINRGDVIVLEGMPRWGRAYLMKQVVGVAGDTYCWHPDRYQHALNGEWMPGPSDVALQLGIEIWEGCRTLEPGEVVGYGAGSDSYDSRYLGPVSVSYVVGIYRLALPIARQP